jgi:hypothetical protein
MTTKMMCGAAMAALGLLLSGCVREAEIAMPSDLRAASERIELAGLGGGERGSFRLGGSEGRFTRKSVQEQYDDGYVRKSGGGSFTADGPEVGGALSARCAFDEAEQDSGILVHPIERLAYRCGFRRGTEIKGELVLDEVPRGRGLLAGRSRAGFLDYDGRRIGIRAIHDMEGGRMPTGTPLGYAFDVEGRQIGAVDLNGGDKTIYAPRAGPEREAVLAASLALSIFWDPGE